MSGPSPVSPISHNKAAGGLCPLLTRWPGAGQGGTYMPAIHPLKQPFFECLSHWELRTHSQKTWPLLRAPGRKAGRQMSCSPGPASVRTGSGGGTASPPTPACVPGCLGSPLPPTQGQDLTGHRDEVASLAHAVKTQGPNKVPRSKLSRTRQEGAHLAGADYARGMLNSAWRPHWKLPRKGHRH